MIKKNLLFAGGTLALSAALLTGGFLLGNNVQSSAEQAATDSSDTNRIIPLTAQENSDKSHEWESKIDGWLASIMDEVNEYLDETMPEGYQEWKSISCCRQDSHSPECQRKGGKNFRTGVCSFVRT